MNLSCIVCAIDSADTSPAVLASAMTLAAWDAAELHVVYLADPDALFAVPVGADQRRAPTEAR